MPFNRDLIKRAREKRGLNVQEVANLVGVDRQAVYNWEAGVAVPKQENRDRLFQVLGIREEIFFEDTPHSLG